LENQYIIIVAGGTGSRMKTDVPKQFLEVGGEAIIIRTVRRFLEYDSEIRIIISVHKDFRIYTEELLLKSGLADRSIQLTEGGNTRFDSVKNGLLLIKDNSAIVGIHDAARPFVSNQTISNCFKTAVNKGNAIPCIPVNESLRVTDQDLSQAVKRDHYKVVQTPQCFRVSEIKEAFLQPYNPSFTDDATVLEFAGGTIHLVEGNIENIKITSPFDLLIANAILTNE